MNALIEERRDGFDLRKIAKLQEVWRLNAARSTFRTSCARTSLQLAFSPYLPLATLVQ